MVSKSFSSSLSLLLSSLLGLDDGVLDPVLEVSVQFLCCELLPGLLELQATEGPNHGDLFLDLEVGPKCLERNSDRSAQVLVNLLFGQLEEVHSCLRLEVDVGRYKNATGLNTLGSVGSAHHLLDHARFELGPLVEDGDVGLARELDVETSGELLSHDEHAPVVSV